MPWIVRLLKRMGRTVRFNLSRFILDQRAVTFDLMGIIFMAIAIFGGNMLGAWVSNWFGVAGGLFGAFILGLCVYVVFCLIAGARMTLMGGVMFAISVYLSGFIVAWIGSSTGLSGGIVGLLVQALVLSMIWGYFSKPKALSTSPKKRKGRRRRKR